MWESVLTDKRLESRDKLNIFRCCISPAQEGVGLFSHARDNIYISSWRCEDFLVLAHFFSFLCHYPFTIAGKKQSGCASQIHTQSKAHAYVHTRRAFQMCDFSFISLITPAPGNLLPLLSNEFCHSLSDSQPALR